MDFRLYPETFAWMQKENILGDCDFISTIPGASMPLQDLDSPEAITIMKSIQASIKLHDLKTLIIMHHNQCGAYSLAYKFANPKEEKDRQLLDMRISKEIVLKNFPGLKVRLVWAELKDDHGKKIVFENVL